MRSRLNLLTTGVLVGGGGRTRTYEGVSQRIYSIPHVVDIARYSRLMSRSCRADRSPLAVQGLSIASGLGILRPRALQRPPPTRPGHYSAGIGARKCPSS